MSEYLFRIIIGSAKFGTLFLQNTSKSLPLEPNLRQIIIVFGFVDNGWYDYGADGDNSVHRPWRPLGLREIEAPIFPDFRLTDGGKVVSPTRRPPFTSQEDFWYSFLLESGSTPGP
jgi:hypothetical protein